MNVNVNLIEENINQINGGITINATVGMKNIYAKKIMCAIQLHAILKMEDTQQVLWIIQRLSVMKL